MEENQKIIVTERRSASDLAHKIQIVKNAAGRYFFTSGNIRGYVSTKTAEEIVAKQKAGETIDRDKYQVADVFIPGKSTEPVTCLMRQGGNVVASF